MTDQPSFNITRVAPTTPVAPASQQGNNANHTRFAEKPVTRNIAPITEYNSKTGNLDVRSDTPWGKPAAETPAVETPAAETATSTTTPDRHTKWREEQAAKKAQREEQRLAKRSKQEALASELLKKQDLVGAAKALGMSPADLATYVDNARLQIPVKTEELTPEQKRAQDEEKFRQERLAFEEEQKAFKYQTIAYNYIKDNIAPVLADKEKFEFIHKYDAAKVQNYIYEFMNKHFQETGEELSPQDVAETIEEQMYNAHVQSLESLKGIKKVAKYFAPAPTPTEVEETQQPQRPTRDVSVKNQIVEPTLANKKARPLDSRFPMQDQEVDQLMAEAEAEEAKITPSAASRRTTSNSNVPFAFLSREERLARMKLERE